MDEKVDICNGLSGKAEQSAEEKRLIEKLVELLPLYVPQLVITPTFWAL
jgi:hypothetical protein